VLKCLPNMSNRRGDVHARVHDMHVHVRARALACLCLVLRVVCKHGVASSKAGKTRAWLTSV
jgi:hypothetical protein